MRFLLVDRILNWESDGTIRGLKCVTIAEDYFTDHFPGNPVMPGVLLLESLVQLAGWGEAATSDFRHWLLLDRVQRCAIYSTVIPGDVLELSVTPLGPAARGRRAYSGTASVAGRKRARAEFEGTLHTLEGLADPAGSRAAFARLARETRS